MADSSPPASPLRILFLIEAAATFLGGTAMLLIPTSILRSLINPTLTFPMTLSSEPSPASVQLLQWVGAFSYVLCVPLLLGAPETARAKASRRMVYYTLGSGELALSILMLWQVWSSGVDGAFSQRALWVSASVLGSILLGRVWMLGWKSEWFEDAPASSHKRRSSNR